MAEAVESWFDWESISVNRSSRPRRSGCRIDRVECVRADRGVSRGDGRDDLVDLDVKRLRDGTLGPDI